MDKEFLHFEKINRETWQNLHRKTTPPLSQTELNSIKSFNDRINLQDVRDVRSEERRVGKECRG